MKPMYFYASGIRVPEQASHRQSPMTGLLQEKAAVVTGAGSTVGRAVTKRFLAEGANVVAADGAGEVEDLMSACRERLFGRLDVVCANVEIPGPPEGTLSGRRMHEWAPADWDQIMGSDARGVFVVIREVLPLLLEAGGGCIICTVSNAPSAGGAAAAGHLLLAGAVVAVVRQAAIEYAAENIRANAICPEHLGTRLLHARPARLDQLAKMVPDDPEEVAALAAFLASDESAYLTGQTFLINSEPGTLAVSRWPRPSEARWYHREG